MQWVLGALSGGELAGGRRREEPGTESLKRVFDEGIENVRTIVK